MGETRQDLSGKPTQKDRRPRIVMTAGFVLILLTLLAGVTVFVVMQRHAEDLVSKSLQASLKSRVELTQAEIATEFDKTVVLVNRSRLIDAVHLANKGGDAQGAIDEIDRVITHPLFQTGLSAVVVYAADGQVLARAGVFSEKPELEVPLNLPGHVQLIWDAQLLLRAAVEIKQAGVVIGKVLTETPVVATTAALSEPHASSETGGLRLCAPFQGDIQCFPSALSPNVSFSSRISISGNPFPMALALAGQVGFTLAHDTRDREVVAAYSPVGQLGLGMVLKMDTAELNAPVWSQLESLIPVLLGMLVLALLLLRWLLTPLVLRLVRSEAQAREASESLAESENRFRRQSQHLSEVIWATDIGTWEWNVRTGETSYNERWVEILGYSAGELGVVSVEMWSELFHPGDRQRATELLQQCLTRELEVYAAEVRMRHKSGEWIWVFTRGRVVEWTTDGQPVRASGTHQDITARKRAEAAILRFKNVLDSTLDMIFMFEPDTLRFVYVNQGAVLSMGYTREELHEMKPYDIKPLFPEAQFRQLIAPLLSGEQTMLRFETLHRRKDDTRFPVAVSLQLVMQDDGSSLFVAIVHDITERKRAQDEILRLNANLEERVAQRTEELQSQQHELQSQQEELRQSNEELEAMNREIADAKKTLEEKAEQLALTSKYKSEFLSNMSHELRTPLNSLLILSQLLTDNGGGTMTAQQTEYAKTIHSAGTELLTLINDILDLSKIESGTVTLELHDTSFAAIANLIERGSRHVAESRGLGFAVELAPGLPQSLVTDSQRLRQVLKNLLSNAFKFTRQGKITLRVNVVDSGWSAYHEGLNEAAVVIGFHVIDTGIGLAVDKQKIIFEAFQQADTGTARRYGGTGLGLSISRELAWLLGGELQLLESAPGRGSTFVLYVPLRAPKSKHNSRPLARAIPTGGEPAQLAVSSTAKAEPPAGGAPKGTASEEVSDPSTTVADDRTRIRPGDRTLLIIEADAVFAGIVLKAARDKGFKCVVVGRGVEGLRFAGELKPTAIALAIRLPDMDGWSVLDRLKRDPETRHIPVEVFSAEGNRPRGLRFGAIEHLTKPVTADSLHRALSEMSEFAARDVKDLLVADGDALRREGLLELIGDGDVVIDTAASGDEALALIARKHYDCMVLGPNLPDIAVCDLIEAIHATEGARPVPVLIYDTEELPDRDQERLKSLALGGVVKKVRTAERLFDETALFLHRVVSKLPEARRQLLEKLYVSADSLAGKKVLVVDDDMRNIFSLTALLERHQMVVLSAENGCSALDELEQNPDVDVVLMDIMMPEMDGFETMHRIRANTAFAALPIIALTAKAMKGDREKCIEAGASDYVSKPVDNDQLVSLLRVWLY